jgi:hypothetical protein
MFEACVFAMKNIRLNASGTVKSNANRRRVLV